MKFHETTLKHSAVETSGRDSRRNEAVRLIEQQDKFRGTSLVDRTCFVLGFQSAILFFPFIQFLVGLDKVIDQAVHVEIESISRERRRTKLVLRWLSFPWPCPSSVEYRGTRPRLFVVEAPLPRSRIDRSIDDSSSVSPFDLYDFRVWYSFDRRHTSTRCAASASQFRRSQTFASLGSRDGSFGWQQVHEYQRCELSALKVALRTHLLFVDRFNETEIARNIRNYTSNYTECI